MTFELGSNRDAPDLPQLFTAPWDRTGVRAFHIDQWSLRHPPLRDRFLAVDAFARLREWGIGIVIGGAARKGWNCGGEILRDENRECVDIVRRHGGVVAAVALDEPLTATIDKGDGLRTGFCDDGLEACADVTAIAIRELHDLGVGAYLWEPFPHFSTAELVLFLQALEARDARPDRFLWDIDSQGWGRQGWWDRLLGRPHGLRRPDVRGDLRAANAWMQARGMGTAICVIGHDTHTQREYGRIAFQHARALRSVFGPADVDAVMVLSWARPPGSPESIETPREIPNNFPASDRTSQLGLLTIARTLWGTP